MSCHHAPGGLQDLLDDVWGRKATSFVPLPEFPAPRERAAAEAVAAATGRPVLSPFQFAKQVERSLDEYVRPLLKRDGGDLEMVDIKDTSVYCRLKGACAGCPNSTQTMKLMVERTLKEMVDERIRVVAV